ncbi:hypothetical protein JCM9957A_49990 [Kineosporia succinea]|uniref:Uncharacterized protein n=1 Tax=Kineosporia succinea TaxID=84632 RepID=A0ABT9PAF6_9ACTN|nr:hypothetical protein [Kineosporia succinea]MDP9829409.1 hypothetical protein [Kineosporia succinea]
MQLVKVYTPADPAPAVAAGALAVVHWGDYRRQEVWVASGANVGNWYPLGNEFHRTPAKNHPVWDDVVARGPVVLVAPGDNAGYQQGWVDGRRRLAAQVEELAEEES